MKKFRSREMNWDINHHERNILEYMFDKKKISGNLAVDIGAHVGTWSIPLSFAFKNVISFEPNRVAYNVLLENLQLNNIHNAQVIKSAVSNEASSATLSIYWGNLSGSHTILKIHPSHSLSSKSKEETVSTVVLDEVVKSPVDFIKIDVEGSENLVLDGAIRTINESNPTMIIEIHGSMTKAGEVIDRLGLPNEVLEWGTPPWKLSKALQDMYGRVKGNYFIYNRGKYDGIRRSMGNSN